MDVMEVSLTKGGVRIVIEDLKEQVAKLYEDPCFLELLESINLIGDSANSLAESYIYQESPYVEYEME